MKLKTINTQLLTLSLLAAALLLPPLAGAQVTVLSNLGQTAANVNDTDSSPPEQNAVSFTTGNFEVALASITLLMANDNSSGTTLAVSLDSNSAGIPGSVVAALTGPSSISQGYQNDVFTAPASTMLLANTTYWIVTTDTDAADAGGYLWKATTSHTADAGSDATWAIGSDLQRYPTFGSGAWTDYDSVSQVQQFSVQVVATPEPGTLALAALGGVGSWLAYRRRK